MTLQKVRTKNAERPRFGSLCLIFLLLFSLALMLRRADVAADRMQKGLSLCARAVVPSLFPFMVLSELLVSSGAGEWLLSPIASPLGRLLGLSRAGCCAVVLGLVCGFPVGARCAILAYEKGTVSKSECERAIACSSIPSSAFLVGTVGTMLWQNAKFGVFLYISVVISALLSGFLLYVWQKKRQKREEALSAPSPFCIRFDGKMFTSAIRNATMNTLLISAYVVFFFTLTGAVGLILDRFAASGGVQALLGSVLELSGGVSAASGLANRYLAMLLTGAAVGWSGISVHCQMLSLCEGHDISLRPYLIAKLLQTVGCVAMVSLFSVIQC